MEEYDKISVLGRGSFGLVQLCRRRVDNTVLVVKQINTPINEEDSKVVAKEVSILSSLRHRHIVRYFDSFLDSENRLSIVMEWARGGSLEELLQQRINTCNSMAQLTQGVFSNTGNNMGPFTHDVQFSNTGNNVGPFTQDVQFSNTGNNVGPFTQDVQFGNIGNNMEPFTRDVQFSKTGNNLGPFTQNVQFSNTGNNVGPFTQDVQFSNTGNNVGPFTQGEQFSSTNNNLQFSNTSMGPFTQVKFRKTCNSTGPFTQDTVLTMLAQLCDALAYLHSRRIVHRDLCARNVLLCGPSDSILYLKLCDFGVSKLLEDSLISGGSYSSEGGQLKGSLECLSPEQCMGLPYTTSCDIWALGCLLYRLISLKHPFPTDNVATLSRHLTSGHFETVTDSTPCDPRLVALMGDMLSRDPHSRPTAHDLIRSPLITPYAYTLYTNLFAFDIQHESPKKNHE